MNLEGRKNNLYFDQSGRQILVGDLLKVYHFKSGNKNYYMYHVVVMEGAENSEKDFPVMACKAHYNDKPHYRLYSLCDNEQRVYYSAKIIGELHWDLKRKKIKVLP